MQDVAIRAAGEGWGGREEEGTRRKEAQEGLATPDPRWRPPDPGWCQEAACLGSSSPGCGLLFCPGPRPPAPQLHLPTSGSDSWRLGTSPDALLQQADPRAKVRTSSPPAPSGPIWSAPPPHSRPLLLPSHQGSGAPLAGHPGNLPPLLSPTKPLGRGLVSEPLQSLLLLGNRSPCAGQGRPLRGAGG